MSSRFGTGVFSVVFLASSIRGDSESVLLTLKCEGRVIKRFEKNVFTLAVGRRYKNPFDPREVDLSLEIKDPSGKTLSLPAFYTQDFELELLNAGRREEEWIYPRGSPHWEVRFTPQEEGRYEAKAVLKDRFGTTKSDPVEFTVGGSLGKGFVRVSSRDPRFLSSSGRLLSFVIPPAPSRERNRSGFQKTP